MPPQFRLRQRPALATPARTPYSFALSSKNMTHVVTEACINCKYTDCVDVCPVDCFKEGPNFLTIDPDECIDCAVCIPECPVNAIYAEEDVPKNQIHMTEINAELARVRELGFALDNEEREEGVHCIGAPIFDYTGAVVATLSVSWPGFRYSQGEESEKVTKTKDAAARDSAILGYNPVKAD